MFIFEMANNHNGSVDLGKEIIDEIIEIKKQYHTDIAVKFQIRDLDTLLHPDFLDKGLKYFERFQSTRLEPDQMKELFNYTKENGLILICTPFDELSLEYLHDMDYIKVASCSNDDWPLLERISEMKIPVIASTGGLDIDGIDNLVNFFKHRDVELSLLHCVARYPMEYDQARLDMITKMKQRYSLKIGYSGHERIDEFNVGIIARALGADIFERHYGKGKLNDYSLNFKSALEWMQSILDVDKSIGLFLDVPDDEIEVLRSLKRGAYLGENYNRYDKIKKVFYAMPLQENQISSGEFGKYRNNFILNRESKYGDPITERPDKNLEIEEIRTIVHRAEGVLAEAGIKIKNYNLQVSHHYGILDFENYGAVWFSLINRAYCKKIGVMFPGQKHPEHTHKIKEEMFHILWGGMTIESNNKIIELNAGDMFLVERYHAHSFYTEHGVIFEEVSTTSIDGDSYYTDMDIVKADELEKKTVVKSY